MDIKTLGDYTLLKKLGSGGFGEVYLAEHRFIKKKFAIKILPEELSSDLDFLTRFEKDVGILATLDHPSIVKVHTISYAEGYYFLVSDAIVNAQEEPMTLEAFLNKKGKVLPEYQVESILKQVASALDYAHHVSLGQETLVHRGLKTTNIFVDDTDKNLHVYVSDFGLSRLIGETKVFLQSFDKFLKKLSFDDQKKMSLLNDFAFLAPEQKSLQSAGDLKIDTYAFGILTYFLIARTVPEGYFEMISKLVPDYKLRWDLLITKCLHPNPQKRLALLSESMNTLLQPATNPASSIEVLSWEGVEKKVESAMQMFFEFPSNTSQPETYTPPLPTIEETPKPLIKPQEIVRPNEELDPGAIFQKELTVSHYVPQALETKEIEPILTEMVIIPKGTYSRGNNQGARDEAPRHKITCSSFALDIHPVTNEQFVRFLEAMGGEKDSNNNDIIRLRDSRIKKSVGKYIIESGYQKHPVVGVTWYGANAYAKWVGKRMVTEAEWEIAACGGNDELMYPTGKEIEHTQANFFNSDTTAVMSYPPNQYGLYDMAGNVYEWCQDWYAYNYYDTSQQEPDNPKGPQQGVYRVLRGGCWKSLKEDLRITHRHRNNPGAVNGTYGFRCAADVS
jgi:formylglycine-generating enzyme required for sulfatase activity